RLRQGVERITLGLLLLDACAEVSVDRLDRLRIDKRQLAHSWLSPVQHRGRWGLVGQLGKLIHTTRQTWSRQTRQDERERCEDAQCRSEQHFTAQLTIERKPGARRGPR